MAGPLSSIFGASDSNAESDNATVPASTLYEDSGDGSQGTESYDGSGNDAAGTDTGDDGYSDTPSSVGLPMHAEPEPESGDASSF